MFKIPHKHKYTIYLISTGTYRFEEKVNTVDAKLMLLYHVDSTRFSYYIVHFTSFKDH